MAKAVELLFCLSIVKSQLQNQKAADQVCWDSQICSVNKTENIKVHKNTIKVAKNGF